MLRLGGPGPGVGIFRQKGENVARSRIFPVSEHYSQLHRDYRRVEVSSGREITATFLRIKYKSGGETVGFEPFLPKM